jgi:hypothetical protein
MKNRSGKFIDHLKKSYSEQEKIAIKRGAYDFHGNEIEGERSYELFDSDDDMYL